MAERNPHGPSETAPRRAGPPEIVTRLQWLMFFRVVMVTVLLGSTLAFNYSKPDPLDDPVRLALLWLIIGTYGLTIVYALVLKRANGWLEGFAYCQLLIDLALTAVVVALTGGTESLFLFMFSLTVLNASVVLYRRGAMYICAVSSGLIVLQIVREVTGWRHAGGPVRDAEVVGVFLSGITHVSAVFLVALLAGYLSEQLRDTGQRLRFASRDLEALKALNEHIITSIQSGLVSYTLDHRVIFFNPSAARITGLEAEEVLYGSILDLFPGLAQRDDLDHRWEEEFVRRDGERRTLGMSLSQLLDSQGEHQGWILIFQDLSPLRRMEEEVRRSEHLAALGKVAAGIAHEIRNPLASMSGSIQMLSRSDRLNPTEQKLMRIVLRETDRLNELITEFLQYARPSPPQLEPLDLRLLLGEMVEVFGFLRYGSVENIPVKVSLEMEQDVRIDADPKQLKQVFWNLLNNAAEAMPEGGPVQVCVRRAAGRVEVQIVDHGVGISQEALERLFEPFFTTKDGGTGLGLALVQRIVEAHGGTIRVESEVGRGTSIAVSLPSSSNPVAPVRMEALHA